MPATPRAATSPATAIPPAEPVAAANGGAALANSPAMSRDLRPLFAPSSVAILGASDDPAKWGNWLARGALRGADRRPVYLINRRGTEVLGQATYRSIEELPATPELVVISVPAAGFE